MSPSDLTTWQSNTRFDNAEATVQLLQRIRSITPEDASIANGNLLAGLEAEPNLVDPQIGLITIDTLEYVSNNLLSHPDGTQIKKSMALAKKLLIEEIDVHAPVSRRLQANPLFVRALDRTSTTKLLTFVNNLLNTQMNQLDINDVNQVKTDLEASLLNIGRGALFNEAPGITPISVNGSKMNVKIAKIDYNSLWPLMLHLILLLEVQVL